MKIALYGATGHVGKEILAEALRRGHDVTAIVRDPARLSASDDRVTVVTGDATDPASVAASVAGQDAVIASISGRRDGDASQITKVADTLMSILPTVGVKRILWVGGAGSLEIAPGVRVIDTPEFPEAYKAEATAAANILTTFRTEGGNLDWTFFSPAAEIAPGERTGVFRLGGDQLLTDAEGHSRISTQDYAVALLDEIESPKHIQKRFTVAY
jgi:uncharacterized protein